MRVLLLVVTAAVSYYLGSLNGAIISARFIFRKDVRDYGSGNAGLTNYYRNFGAPGVALVMLIDIAKSVAAVLIGGALLGIVGANLVGRFFAGFCLIMGHIFPAYYQFRGGKGVLCGLTVAFLVDWRVGLSCLLAFGLVVIFTRYVSLGSIVSMALFPVFLWMFGYDTLSAVLALLCALLVVIKHAENIVRLIGGTESRLKIGRERPGHGRDYEDDD